MSAEELPANPAPLAEPGAETDAQPQGLTLVSVSRDGRRMLFVDEAGREFTVDIDDRLRAALPADSPRRSEPPVTNPPSSSLRPRDIQNRIRAGESAEDVAAAAGTTVDKIMAFAGPVLAEREHMAERAQKASVRRRAGDPAGTARTLGEAVVAHLRSIDLEPDIVSWDSWRRPDGRWKLTAEYSTPAHDGIAELTFDVQGNYVALDNDDARWLVGDKVEVTSEVTPVRDDLEVARQRRQQVPSPPPPASPATAPSEGRASGAVPPAAAPAADVSPVETPLEIDTPVEAYLFDDPVADRKQPEQAAPAEESVAEEPAAAKPRRTSRRKRASVPSWDEIMFGGGKSE
ncbi:septation protein SepH [Nocardioides sp. KR10-350]|uniref:septation protein SepH n=1 Tax=Nocardioides cheoyonin TaxID=3156615 RepID=UPI0032B43866